MIATVLAVIVFCLLASLLTWWTCHLLYTSAANEQIEKYRQRWLNALEVMKGEGQITEAQYTELIEAAKPPPPAEREYRHPDQARLDDMYSEDRADLEVARAKAGLAPADDLDDMFSEDIKRVLKARVKHGTDHLPLTYKDTSFRPYRPQLDPLTAAEHEDD